MVESAVISRPQKSLFPSDIDVENANKTYPNEVLFLTQFSYILFRVATPKDMVKMAEYVRIFHSVSTRQDIKNITTDINDRYG